MLIGILVTSVTSVTSKESYALDDGPSVKKSVEQTASRRGIKDLKL